MVCHKITKFECGKIPVASVFVDGRYSLNPTRMECDFAVRVALEDRGYRVIAIRFAPPLEEQIRSTLMYSAREAESR